MIAQISEKIGKREGEFCLFQFCRRIAVRRITAQNGHRLRMVRLIPRIIFDKGDSLRRHFIESRRIFFIDPVPLARLDDDQDDVLSLQRTRIEIGVAIGFAAHLPFRKIIVRERKAPVSKRCRW